MRESIGPAPAAAPGTRTQRSRVTPASRSTISALPSRHCPPPETEMTPRGKSPEGPPRPLCHLHPLSQRSPSPRSAPGTPKPAREGHSRPSRAPRGCVAPRGGLEVRSNLSRGPVWGSRWAGRSLCQVRWGRQKPPQGTGTLRARATICPSPLPEGGRGNRCPPTGARGHG